MPLLLLLLALLTVSFPSLSQDVSTQIRGPKGTDRAPVRETVVPQNLAPETIGPLTPVDTLWRIAERIKPQSNISTYQVMYALYQKNPEAFIDGNLNHLRPGATLTIPSEAEMRAVNIATARQKSDADDKSWAQRNKPAAKPQAVVATEKAAEPAVSSTASAAIQEELQRVEQQQKHELSELRKQFRESMMLVETMEAENLQLRTTLSKLQTELEKLKSQLGDDTELQQLKQLVQQQSEALAQQQVQANEPQDGFSWQNIASNPVSWILAACLPALLLLFGVLLWVKRRSKQTEEVLNAANTETPSDPLYRSPLPPLEDTHELDDASLFELDEALLDEAFTDTASVSAEDSAAEYSDDILLEDDSLLPEVDEPVAQQLTDSESEAAIFNTDFDADNILSDTDLSALFAVDDEPEQDIVELADDTEYQLADISEPEIDDKSPETVFDEQTEDIELDIPVEADIASLQEQESFNSSELDAFAESLVAESDADQNSEYADDKAEQLLTEELNELLAQVENEQQSQISAVEPDITALDDISAGDVAAEDELLDEIVDLDEPAPDLSSSEDSSVSRISDAALAVENPSDMLDEYPELDLASTSEFDDFDVLLDEDELVDISDYQSELDDEQFDALLNELEAMAEHADNEPELSEQNETIHAEAPEKPAPLTDADFVEIDHLLSATEAEDENADKFTSLNVDVGLDEFADIIDEPPLDVDAQDNGFAKQLDLVRAYIEIDEFEHANLVIDDILASDAPEHVKQEALQLKTEQ